jgi:hypothetical protein
MRHLSTRYLPALLITLLVSGIAACIQSSGLDIGEERLAPNEHLIETEMIELIKQVSLQRQNTDSHGVMRRFNQTKTIACVRGEMDVFAPSKKSSVGLFSAPATYPVILRFANATKNDDRKPDLRGLSIRVLGVLDATGAGGTPEVQDFVLNSYPALFAGTPEDFLDFIRSISADHVWWYLLTHPKSLMIAVKARGNHQSPLNVDYFSMTPYRHGAGTTVKYAVRSCNALGSPVSDDHANYLRDALQHDLRTQECIHFQVQFQTDPDTMPIEDASVIWSEDISPFVTVATIRLPAQVVGADNESGECEGMVFNPWNGRLEHQPLGGINRVRRQVYEVIGAFRSQHNQVH